MLLSGWQDFHCPLPKSKRRKWYKPNFFRSDFLSNSQSSVKNNRINHLQSRFWTSLLKWKMLSGKIRESFLETLAYCRVELWCIVFRNSASLILLVLFFARRSAITISFTLSVLVKSVNGPVELPDNSNQLLCFTETLLDGTKSSSTPFSFQTNLLHAPPTFSNQHYYKYFSFGFLSKISVLKWVSLRHVLSQANIRAFNTMKNVLSL